jgi:hypothetical protein
VGDGWLCDQRLMPFSLPFFLFHLKDGHSTLATNTT